MDAIVDRSGKIRLTPTLKEKAKQKNSVTNEVDDIKATIERQEKSDVQIAQQSASLLNIPAELRSRIWHLVLEDDVFDCYEYERPNYLNIDYPWYPAILRACRQTRFEGSPIYYNVNKFALEITDNMGPPPPSHWLMSEVPRQNIELFLCYMEANRWNNIKDWLQNYHEGRSMGLEATQGSGYAGWSKLFDMVELLQSAPWSTVNAVLEAHKEATEGIPGDHQRFYN